MDGDGKDDLIIGANPTRSSSYSRGEAYLIAAADLAAMDAADGTTDGLINLDNVEGYTSSYTFFVGDFNAHIGTSVASAGDVDGDGKDDLILGAPSSDGAGDAYLMTSAALAAADAADGTTDGAIDLENAAGLSGSYQFKGREPGDDAGISVASAGDVDGDGKGDLIIGAYHADSGGNNAGEAYLITIADLDAADAADGTTDGVIYLDNVSGQTSSYRFISPEPGGLAGISVASAGDVDGDGKADLFIGARNEEGGAFSSGGAYLITSAELAAADADDGTTDHLIYLNDVADNIAGDAGKDRLFGGLGDDRLEGGGGIDHVSGGVGNDWLDGGDAADKVLGGDGDDTVLGGDGNDYVKGGAGTDTIDGGLQSDRLYGGDGEDVFVFSSDMISAYNRDWIKDWEDNDRIDLSDFDLIGSGETAADAFAELTFVQSREHTVVKIDGYGNHSIVLDTTDIATMDVDDFIF